MPHPRASLPPLGTRLALTGMLLAAITGCAGTGNNPTRGTNAASNNNSNKQISEAELQERLRDFGVRFAQRIEIASMHVTRETQSNQVRMYATYWKLLSIPACRAAMQDNDPRIALIDTWTLNIQQLEFFDTEPGKVMFGTLTPDARMAAAQNLADIEDIAQVALTEKHRQQTRDAVYKFAKENPLDWSMSRLAIRPTTSSPSPGAMMMETTLNTVFRPLRSIGSMDETARAIHEVAQAAENINTSSQFLPSEMRWNVELLLYQLNDLQAVLDTRANLDAMTQTAKELPANMREQASILLKEIDAQQPQLQATLQRARDIMAEANAALPVAKETATGVADAGKELTSAIKALDQMLKRWDTPPGAPPEKEPEHPFDINEWRTAADSIGKAAVELRSGIQELDRFIGSDSPIRAIDLANANARSLARYITYCAIAVVASIFLAVVAARYLQRRAKQ